MPLSAPTLSAAIYTAITTHPNRGFSSTFASDAAQQQSVQAWCDAIATAVVAHLTTNALVTVTGVQTGGGAAAGFIT